MTELYVHKLFYYNVDLVVTERIFHAEKLLYAKDILIKGGGGKKVFVKGSDCLKQVLQKIKGLMVLRVAWRVMG